jgi:hypothetical protein
MRSIAFVRTAIVPLLLWVVAPAASSAQSIPSAYRFIETRHEAGAFAGLISMDTGPFEFGPEGGILTGLRYALELSGPFSLEGVTSLVAGERSVVDPRRAEGSRIIGTADTYLTSVDARLKFALNGRRTWYGLGPYLTAGGGFLFDLAGEGELDRELDEDDRFSQGNSFLGVMGGGIRFFPTERLVLRADLEGRFWKIGTPSGFSEAALGLGPVERDQWVSGWGFMLGAALRF